MVEQVRRLQRNPFVDLRKPHPPSLSPRALAIAGWGALLIAGALFLAIAWNVTARSALVALDSRLADWLHGHATGALVGFFVALTHLHSPVGIAVWSAIFGAVLARLREWYWIGTLAMAVVGGMLMNTLLKVSYERVRPKFDQPLLVLTSFSFPSGHTAGAVLFYGVLAAFLVSRFYDWRRRAAIVAAAMLAVTLVAFSRLYLGAHFLSDVMAAGCAATVWLVLCLTGGHALVRRELRPEWLGGACFVALIVGSVLLVPPEWWQGFESRIEEMNLLAALAVFCGIYATALLILFPTWIFPVAAGALFGFGWGIVAGIAALMIACAGAFLLSRHVVRSWVQRGARNSKTFKALDHAVAKDPWKIVVLLRLAPVIPEGLKSYFLGLTRVKLETYLTASLVGLLPDLVIKVYLGAAGRGAIAQGGTLDWVSLAAGILALFGLSFFVGRRVRKALKV